MDSINQYVQHKLDVPMQWIGLYIAAASAVCTLAMAADVFNGFRSKKLWFPCKYFSLNAASLTMLAVAMKLPMDLNTMLLRQTDWFAKLSSLIFMSTAQGNLISSLGSMNDREIVANIVALGILVITIMANMWIQLIQLQNMEHADDILEVLLPTMLMLVSLATVVSLALTVSTTKRRLEAMYRERHEAALREEEVVKRTEAFSIDKQRRDMMRYWVMAETSSPQFVMARSVVCTTSCVICLLAAITLIASYGQWFMLIHKVTLGRPGSVYGGYTIWIQVVQSIGLVVGTIAPTLRWYMAARFRCSAITPKNFRDEFKIETHWIQALVDSRDSHPTLQILHHKWRRYLHDAKWFALTFCIGVQVSIVIVSKLLVAISALFMKPFFLRKKIKNQHSYTSSCIGTELNLRPYVLLLEGEAELPNTFVESICRQADEVIEIGKTQQSQDLIHLLNKSSNFNGLREFDSLRVPSLHSQEPPNCWTLPLVTMTSIAIALPKVANHIAKQLVSTMSEAMSLAELVDKTLDKNARLVSIRNAADFIWGGVVLYGKWQDLDLRKTSLNCKNPGEVLRKLSSKAERIVMEFKREAKDTIMETNPLNWPAKVIAANSMYRICQTILLSCEHENDEVFEQITRVVADILAACFTNLACVVRTMCRCNAIEQREKSVREAFLLLGKTERVVEFVRQHEWPCLDDDKAAYIEEWRHINQNPEASTLVSNGAQVTVRIHC